MKYNELLEDIAERELDKFTTAQVIAWAISRINYMSSSLHTILAGTLDVPKNEVFMRHLGDAQYNLDQAAKVGEEIIDKLSKNVSLLKDRIEFKKRKIIPSEFDDKDMRRFISMKTTISDFIMFWTKNHVNLADTDKMAGLLSSFMKELDEFEEEMYYAV